MRPDFYPFWVVNLPVPSISGHCDHQQVTVRIYFQTSALHNLVQHIDSKHENVLDAFPDSFNFIQFHMDQCQIVHFGQMDQFCQIDKFGPWFS